DAEYVQLFEPTASVFEKEGQGHVIASFGEESGLIPYTVFMTKESYLNENEDVVTSFTKAIYKAQQWVEETDAEEIAEVVQPYFEDTEIEIIASSIERYKQQDSYANRPHLIEEAWVHMDIFMNDAAIVI